MTDKLTPERVRALLSAAEPHLSGCEILATRRTGSDADWTAVRDLARMAPDLARAYLDMADMIRNRERTDR
jgi:hypothetical protein